jgi:hypothetical protein
VAGIEHTPLVPRGRMVPLPGEYLQSQMEN